jgi:hypothetical protein
MSHFERCAGTTFANRKAANRNPRWPLPAEILVSCRKGPSEA